MIDAVIRNLIKLMKILKSQITLLNILEDTDINRDTVYKHRQASVKKKKEITKKKTPNAEKFSINP